MKISRKIRSNLEYISWKIKNPKSNYSDYYVQMVNGIIKKDKSHQTLGQSYSDNEWFVLTGNMEFEFLTDRSTTTQSKCLDYGCGSLRLGRHMIEFLDPGNYYGLDITADFFSEGLKTLDKKMLETKKPFLDVINEDTLKQLEDVDLDVIVSTNVLMHVPKQELNGYFANIIRLMDKNTNAYITFKDHTEYIQTARATWCHSRSQLEKEITRLGAKTEFIEHEELNEILGYPEGSYRILNISKN